MKNGNIKAIIIKIKQYDSIVIFHHIKPDGDCLGSQLGLKELIKTNFPNKKVYAIGEAGQTFKFMKFKHDKIPSDKILSKSLGIVIDANYQNRIECPEVINKVEAMMRIDHHPVNDDIDYATRWVDSSYVASAEQIAHIAFNGK
jgi:phosphoesterase RecJ-like protein